MTTYWEIVKIWACFFMPFSPLVPKVGNVFDGDCVFAQAFGRGEYTDEALGSEIFELRTSANFSDYPAMETLQQLDFIVGRSNMTIARHCLAIAKELGIPIIGQWEVMYAIFLLDPAWYYHNRPNLVAIWPPRTGYFATYHVKAESVAEMHRRGLFRPIEVANPAMTSRAVMTIWKLGVQPIVEPVSLRQIVTGQADLFVFDEVSVQPWTRSFPQWIVRETVGRLIHVLVWVVNRVRGNALIQQLPEPITSKLPGDWIAFLPHNQR